MSTVTHYIIFPFVRDSEGNLVAGQGQRAYSNTMARFRAAFCVGIRQGDETIVGAVAFMRTGDSRPVILAKYGETPKGLAEME
ncbi:hypothetical protein ACETRX_16150 [Labrys portucalensis]|uniref:Uncharacterized protein n=1 Tax=Labrys neptuniae TaxID=376174 RepID=A0ABV3PPA4_9HYPH|nr:hypothetical protein [Labrys neptuniae]MDT3378497.1 hypothetical protein [Labrys neptuniae]